MNKSGYDAIFIFIKVLKDVKATHTCSHTPDVGSLILNDHTHNYQMEKKSEHLKALGDVEG